MSFLNNNSVNLLNTKLTANGRKALSRGKLNFKYYSLSDSEINYNSSSYIDQKIISPKSYNSTTTALLNPNCELYDLSQVDYKRIKLSNPISLSSDISDYVTISGVSDVSYGNTIDLGQIVSGDIICLTYSDGSKYSYNFTTTPASTIVTLDRNLPNISDNVNYEILDYNINNFSGNTVYYDTLQQKFKYNCDYKETCEIQFNLVNQNDLIGYCSGETVYNISNDCITEEFTIESQSNICDNYLSAIKVLGYGNCSNSTNVGNDCSEQLLSTQTNPNSVGIISFDKELSEFICIENDKLFILDLGGEIYTTSGQTENFINNQYYYDLVNSNNIPIGRVYHYLQIITIDNQELLSSLNGYSNRNYVYPNMSARLVTDNVNGILYPNQTIYLTYQLTNSLGESLPSQNVIEITNTTNVRKNIEFYFDDLTNISNLQFNSLKLIYQINSVDGCSWKQVDFTENINTGGFVDLQLATDKKDYLLDNFKFMTSTSYKLAYLSNVNIQCEKKIDVKLDFHVGKEIYKSVFNIQVDGSKIKTSKNCTYKNGNIVLTDIGIYNSDRELVVISKLTQPLILDRSSMYNFEINVDF